MKNCVYLYGSVVNKIFFFFGWRFMLCMDVDIHAEIPR